MPQAGEKQLLPDELLKLAAKALGFECAVCRAMGVKWTLRGPVYCEKHLTAYHNTLAIHRRLAEHLGWRGYIATEPYTVKWHGDIHLPVGNYRIDGPDGMPLWLEGQDHTEELAWEMALTYRIPQWPHDLNEIVKLVRELVADDDYIIEVRLYPDGGQGACLFERGICDEAPSCASLAETLCYLAVNILRDNPRSY